MKNVWALVVALAMLPAAHADIFGYVDDKGIAHFAAEKIDERYQLFSRGGQGFDTSQGLAAPGVVVEGLGAGRKIGPGAEGAARSRDDHHAHRVVRVGHVKGRDHLLHHPGIEGVQLLRAVQRDRRDPILHRIEQGLECRLGHGAFLWHWLGSLSCTCMTVRRSRGDHAPQGQMDSLASRHALTSSGGPASSSGNGAG